MSPVPPKISHLRTGKRAVQKQFYLSEFDRLIRIPLRYVNSRSEAISILNDAFLKIFDQIDNLREDSKFNSWSAAIVRNTTLDYVRKQVKYNQKHTDLEHNEGVNLVLNEALQNMALKEILSFVQALEEKERIIFSMFAIDGFKHSEIAKELKISVGTSKWYLNKARTSLQQSLKPYSS